MSSHSGPIHGNRSWKGDGADKSFALGYKPKRVDIMSETGVVYTKTLSMDTDKAVKRDAAGAATFPSAVELTDDGFKILAAENTDTVNFHYYAMEEHHDA